MRKSFPSGKESGHRSDAEDAEKLWDTDDHGHTWIIECVQIGRIQVKNVKKALKAYFIFAGLAANVFFIWLAAGGPIFIES